MMSLNSSEAIVDADKEDDGVDDEMHTIGRIIASTLASSLYVKAPKHRIE
jgi:hypothetical protein